MKRKLIAAGIASAFMIAGPAIAGGDKNAAAGVDSKTDASVSSSTSTPQPSVSTSSSTDASASTGSSSVPSANEPQKKRGLDRADEAAGDSGKHGRDNARAKQERNAERKQDRLN